MCVIRQTGCCVIAWLYLASQFCELHWLWLAAAIILQRFEKVQFASQIFLSKVFYSWRQSRWSEETKSGMKRAFYVTWNFFEKIDSLGPWRSHPPGSVYTFINIFQFFSPFFGSKTKKRVKPTELNVLKHTSLHVCFPSTISFQTHFFYNFLEFSSTAERGKNTT